MATARFLVHLFFLLLLVSTAPAVRTTPDATAATADKLPESCNKTLFPKVCVDSLTDNPESHTACPRRLAELSVNVAAEMGTTVAAFAHRELNGVKDDGLFKCLDSCSDDIEEAVAHLSALTRELTDAKFLEVKSWLSSTLGGSSTCEEACRDAPISDVKNVAIAKSFEFEKLLRVTLDLITEASGYMSAKVALPPSALGAGGPSYVSPYGAPYGAPYRAPSAGAPGYGAPSADAPAYGARRPSPRARAPSPSAGTPAYGPKRPSPRAPAPSAGAPAYGARGPSPRARAPAPSAGAPVYGARGPSPRARAPAPSAGAPAYGARRPSPRAPAPSASAPAYGARGPSPRARAPVPSAGAPAYGARGPSPHARAPALLRGGKGSPAPSKGGGATE